MNDQRARAALGYLEARVRSASPAELISLLYEGLARELRLAAQGLDRGDLEARGIAIGRSVAILGELRGSLDHEAGGEVATNLERLYAYWTRRITEANATSSRPGIDHVLGLVESLRAAWNEGVLAAVRAGQLALATAASGAAAPPGQPSPGPAPSGTAPAARQSSASKGQAGRSNPAPEQTSRTPLTSSSRVTAAAYKADRGVLTRRDEGQQHAPSMNRDTRGVPVQTETRSPAQNAQASSTRGAASAASVLAAAGGRRR